MNCSRCGGAEAVVKRGAAFYCGKCALARDWEEVVALVQEERVAVRTAPPPVGFDAPMDESAESVPASNGQLPADPFG